MHESWTAEARTVLDHVCASHGGVERYARLGSVSLTPRQVTGRLPSRKGLRRSFPLPRRFDVFPHDRCTVFVDYPDPGYDGVFDDGHVWIRHHETGEVAAESPDHRTTLAGVEKYRRWDALDALYFFGETLCRHQTLPFSLADAELLGLRSTGGQRPLTIVDVLCADAAVPGRRQSFYFDWAGRLQRHDYQTDAVGAWTSVAAFFRDYQRIDGLALPMELRIAPRLGGRVLPSIWLLMTFAGITVSDGREQDVRAE